ncbi:MAG: threonine ammonia-lyase [Alphaproteobacteria bacterium]|nr:threonine ammonia-lyase [Alphaproteobacteria bacterium]
MATGATTAAFKGLPLPGIDDIRAAAAVIHGAVERTPTHHSRTLSKIAGCDIYLKFENLQFTASFKERGALNKLMSLTPEQRRRGVVAMSAGNHAQAVAYHGSRLGIPVTIVMPEGAPFVKIKRTREFGAEVVQFGATLTEGYSRARELADTKGFTLVHPYDDPKIIAGTGTVGLELLEDAPDIDTIVVPIGGGGLISGIAIAAKAAKPSIKLYGVQAALYPSMYDAFKGETQPCGGQTIAEGIAVKSPGQLTRAIIDELVEDVLLVREDEIESALASLLEIEKTVVEGAAATGFAAVTKHPEIFRGHKVAIVLSGGNIDMRLLSNVILRELSREGRLLSLGVEIEDRPGWLARIATVVSETGGNILEVSHDRMMMDLSARSADLGLVIEARDATHADEIRTALESAGFRLREPQISRAISRTGRFFTSGDTAAGQ